LKEDNGRLSSSLNLASTRTKCNDSLSPGIHLLTLTLIIILYAFPHVSHQSRAQPLSLKGFGEKISKILEGWGRGRVSLIPEIFPKGGGKGRKFFPREGQNFANFQGGTKQLILPTYSK